MKTLIWGIVCGICGTAIAVILVLTFNITSSGIGSLLGFIGGTGGFWTGYFLGGNQ